MADVQTRIDEIENRLKDLPKGSLTYKKINGKQQPYLQRTIDGKSKSYYIKSADRERVLMEIEERGSLLAELKRLQAYREKIQNILALNPFLAQKVSRGHQDFAEIMKNNLFYVDKTCFLKEWWENADAITLITRPRRFGKTLMLSMVENFLSPFKKDSSTYFKKLVIWNEEKYRKMQGTIPVVFLTFGATKGNSSSDIIRAITTELSMTYDRFHFLFDSNKVNETLRKQLRMQSDRMAHFDNSVSPFSIRFLCEAILQHYGIAPVVLLDEYDTPLTEAYAAGFLDELMPFYRQFISETFKNNRAIQRALITGVAVIAKNSLFSDMNHVVPYSCTDEGYSDCFGFTEEEVKNALLCQDMNEMAQVKEFYDGFCFGGKTEIYNPWSITNYMVNRRFDSYWINTASNDLVGDLIRRYPMRLKRDIEELMQKRSLHKCIHESVVLQYMDVEEDAFWALLLATGYIKAVNVVKTIRGTECDISITNRETETMFENQILRMFPKDGGAYDDFAAALLNHQWEEMNIYLNDLTCSCMSYFDTGRRPSEKAPENFYHGLVLGLLVSLRDRYKVRSNRESGLGRYDIALIPIDRCHDAFLIEFKVRNPKKEQSLTDTAVNALLQIEEKRYEADLLIEGIAKEQIYQLGVAFEGKEALILQKTDCRQA